jgi:hypothetical protein
MGFFFARTLRPVYLPLFLLLLFSSAAVAQGGASGDERIGESRLRARAHTALEFQFAENIGQWKSAIRFSGRAGSSSVTFGADRVGFRYRVRDRGVEREYHLSTEFVGALSTARVIGEESTGARFNYYLGADRSTWHVGARGFSQIRYSGIYRGVDALYHGSNGSLKYDFILSPGADPAAIRLRYSGARSLRLTRKGELDVRTPFGSVREAAPYCYQQIGGERVEVEGRYRLLGATSYGFVLGAYDARYPVVIDPCLSVEYSTYFGGGSYDVVSNIAVDSAGFAYVTGVTTSTDFPTIPPGESPPNTYAYISKLSPDGTRLLYSTLVARPYNGAYTSVGSTSIYESLGVDVEVTAAGEAVVALSTNVANQPTTLGAYQREISPNPNSSLCGRQKNQNFECYVARFDAGGRFSWGTYIGGSDNDYLADIAMAPDGSIYMTGFTHAIRCTRFGHNIEDRLSFPVTVGFGTFSRRDTIRGFESFATRLSPDGRRLSFSTLLGGSADDFAGRIAIDRSGKMIIFGSTLSTDFPTTPGSFQRTAPEGLGITAVDLFITRIDPVAATLEYGSYVTDYGNGRTGLGFGGYIRRSEGAIEGFTNPERQQSLLIGGNGVLYLGGTTRSLSVPMEGGAVMGAPPGTNRSGERAANGYLLAFDIASSRILGATYLGGSEFDALGGATFDLSGNIVVTLATESKDIPITSTTLEDKLTGEIDAAIFLVSSDLRRLLFSTYLGGSKPTAPPSYREQTVTGMSSGKDGALYLFGGTASPDFPLTAGAIKRRSDFFSGYIVKFVPPGGSQIGTGITLDFPPDPCSRTQYQGQLIFNSGQIPLKIESLRLTDGRNFSLQRLPSYPATLGSCDTLSLTVAFSPDPSLGCDKIVYDTIIITSSNAITREVRVPVTGRTPCVQSYIPLTTADLPRFRLGLEEFYDFELRIRGLPQYGTIRHLSGDSGIFIPTPEYDSTPLREGITYLRFKATPPDTGRFCESFAMTIEPCSRVTELNICAYFRTGIYSGPDSIPLGKVACGWSDRPFAIRNTGNDTLTVQLARIVGAGMYEFTVVPRDPRSRMKITDKMKIPPNDSLELTVKFIPFGYGKRDVLLQFVTDEGFKEKRNPEIRVTAQVDSTAFALSTTTPSIVGGFGQLFDLPIDYDPILVGEAPTAQLAFVAHFDPAVLELVDIVQTGSLSEGWQLIENKPLTTGAQIHIVRRDKGDSLRQSGRFFSLRFRVLRGSVPSSKLAVELEGVSEGCLAATIDSGWIFQLDSACAAYDRFVYTGKRILKQSLPNPASSETIIPFSLPQEGVVTLVLYDINGQEVARPIPGDRIAEGDHELAIPLRDLSPGRYFYRILIDGEIRDTRSMEIKR